MWREVKCCDLFQCDSEETFTYMYIYINVRTVFILLWKPGRKQRFNNEKLRQPPIIFSKIADFALYKYMIFAIKSIFTAYSSTTQIAIGCTILASKSR